MKMLRFACRKAAFALDLPGPGLVETGSYPACQVVFGKD